MSDPDHKANRIHDLIAAGRGSTLDWVIEDAPVEMLATTMAAMANGQGGTLLVGVSAAMTGSATSGSVTATNAPVIAGVGSDVKAIDLVLKAALSLQPPLIIPLPKVVAVAKGKKLIEAHIPNGMPHVYAQDGRYLTRVDTINAPLAPTALRRLFMERGEISFESAIANGADLDDIDWDKVRAYVAMLKGISENDPQQVLLQRGCLTKRGETLRPTNAGILLFGKDPQRYIRGAEITAVRFAGETMGDTFSRQDITGTLPDQIKRAETFLVDHLRKGVELKGTMARKEQHEYPMEAAREIVVNAVAHRDYSISGDGVRLFIFANRLDVSNPGKLAGPVTLANIKDERFSRNPVIVQVLSDMGYIERLGYGVDRVIELMNAQSLKAPDFQETEGGFRVTLYKSEQSAPKPQPAASTPTPENTDALTAFLLEHKQMAFNPRQEGAIAYLLKPANNRITNSELQRMYSDVHAETIRRDLAALVTKDILVKRGQKRGSYYILKRDLDPGVSEDLDASSNGE